MTTKKSIVHLSIISISTNVCNRLQLSYLQTFDFTNEHVALPCSILFPQLRFIVHKIVGNTALLYIIVA